MKREHFQKLSLMARSTSGHRSDNDKCYESKIKELKMEIRRYREKFKAMKYTTPGADLFTTFSIFLR